MANIFPGYRGSARIYNLAGGSGEIGNIRFADANITLTQEVDAPDLIMGDWDHNAYVYGPITVGGSISGPVTETFASAALSNNIWDWAVKRYDNCGTLTEADIDLFYYCGTPDCGTGYTRNFRTFNGMLANSVNFSVTAGDVANFSIDVLGKSASAWQEIGDAGAGGTLHNTTSEKLITWDKVSITVGGSGPGAAALISAQSATCLNFQSFDFTIANNLETVYSLNQDNLFPVEIVSGLRTITGSITAYNIPQALGVDSWDDYVASDLSLLTFEIGDLTIEMFVQFHRIAPASSVGVITSTLGFTGVGHQTGAAWIG